MDLLLRAVSDEEPKSARQLATETGVGQKHAQVTLQMLREAKLVKKKRLGFVRKSKAEITAQEVLDLIATSEERAAQDRNRLDEMMRYAESVTCRRQILREYFGEPVGAPCESCDNCVNRKNHVEREAAMSLVERTGARRVESARGSFFTTAPQTLPTVSAASAFSVGQVVVHAKFGQGTVKCVEQDVLTIRFKNDGVKKLKSSFVEALPEAA